MEWTIEKVATLLMWSGTEVAQAVLGKITEIGEKDILYALGHVCAIEDIQTKSTHYMRCMCGKGGWK